MSDAVWIALIPAGSAIVVAVITLAKGLITDWNQRRAARMARQLGVNDELMGEYRNLLAEERQGRIEARAAEERIRLELADEREQHRKTAEDRDRWRVDATRNARRVAEYIEKETP